MDDLLAELQAEMGGSKGVNPAPVKAQEQDKSTFEPEDEEAALERKLAEAKAAKAAKAKAAEEAAKARASQLDAIHTAEQAGKSVDKLTDAEIGAMVRAIFKAVR